MDNVINFLVDNYFIIAGFACFLILALIGYIIDTKKTEKLKKEFAKEKEQESIMPIKEIQNDIKLGTTGTINDAVKQESPSIEPQVTNPNVNNNAPIQLGSNTK